MKKGGIVYRIAHFISHVAGWDASAQHHGEAAAAAHEDATAQTKQADARLKYIDARLRRYEREERNGADAGNHHLGCGGG